VVPVQGEPFEVVDERVDGVFGDAGEVGVFERRRKCPPPGWRARRPVDRAGRAPRRGGSGGRWGESG